MAHCQKIGTLGITGKLLGWRDEQVDNCLGIFEGIAVMDL